MSKTERERRYVKHRRALQLCGHHGCKLKSGDAFRCDEHAAHHAAKMQRLREARRALKVAA